MTAATASSVCAIIPSFNPEEGLIACVDSVVANGILEIVIVDDGSDTAQTNVIISRLVDDYLDSDARVTVIRKPENSGIASSLNVGIAHARNLQTNCTAVLTLDQDSVLPRNYVAAALREWSVLERKGLKVGVLAPEAISGRKSKGDPSRSVSGHTALFDPIQSAAVIPLSVLDEVGCFNEDLVIDGVDTEFNYRCLEHGLGLYAVPHTDLEHAIGTPVPLRLFGRPATLFGRRFYIGEHSPTRLYYITRNSMVIARGHRQKLGRWRATRRQLVDLPSLLIALTLSDNRKHNRQAVHQALHDASRGILGKRQPPLSGGA